MTVRILRGDCRDMLRTLAAESVHTVVTSPPYWGLRDYGLPPSLWGGDAGCQHEFGKVGKRHRGGPPGDGEAFAGRDQSARAATADILTGQTCMRCGAWFGCLGLEPTPQLYVEHLVEVFREVRRVLRADGTLWLNLGDSYATGAGNVGDHPGGGEQGARWKGETTRHRDDKRRAHGQPALNGRGAPQAGRADSKYDEVAAIGPTVQPNRMPIPGLKPKDLVGVPWRVAFALQGFATIPASSIAQWADWLREAREKGDWQMVEMVEERLRASVWLDALATSGWWLRQDIIWHKPNPMPESVRDRCTKSHEYIFLLSKSESYYFDNDAIAEPVSGSTIERMSQPGLENQRGSDRVPGKPNGPMKAVGHRPGNKTHKGTTAYQKGDEKHRTKSGLVDYAQGLQETPTHRNKRSVWTVTTQPFKEAHFATFPPALIEPCILAGAPHGGVVLDPFGGAGTTGLVADRLGRDAVLIELKPDYADMALRRIQGDSPLFAEVQA